MLAVWGGRGIPGKPGKVISSPPGVFDVSGTLGNLVGRPSRLGSVDVLGPPGTKTSLSGSLVCIGPCGQELLLAHTGGVLEPLVHKAEGRLGLGIVALLQLFCPGPGEEDEVPVGDQANGDTIR